MLVINTNNHAVTVKIQTPEGPDTVHIQAKGRVNLGEGRTVDSNWKAQHGAGVRIPALTETQTATPSVPATLPASED